MRKRSLYVIVWLILMYFIVSPVCFYVEASGGASQQPEVCWWPSKTMSMYFEFQNEVKWVLFWSELNSKIYSLWSHGTWLFSSEVLKLWLVWMVANDVYTETRKVFSTATTSVALLLLASASVVQSSVDWFVILFKDRPIVRDYKYMLDIETQLFDIAFFRSQQIDLTRPFESQKLVDELVNIIKKYQKLWLLEETGNGLLWNPSMVDVLSDLISMNSRMRNFIVFRGDNILDGYNWCLWNIDIRYCDKGVAVLRFSDSAIKQLDEDYKWIWAFWACNLYASNFKNTISKSNNDNINSVKVAMQDVKDAWVRLKNVFAKDRWNLVKDPCNMSDYEMAQLRAYWWWDWTCWEWVWLSSVWKLKNGVSSAFKKWISWIKNWVSVVKNWVSSAFKKIKEYFRNKKVQIKKDSKPNTAIDVGANSNKWDNWALRWTTTQEKQQQFVKEYWTNENYNSEFNENIRNELLLLYDEMQDDFLQSQSTSSQWDFSYELVKIRWLIDQVEATSNAASSLEKSLQKIADYQCNW